MSDRESPVIVVEKGGGGVGAFLIGALLGAGAALLLAPRSGEETQAELRAQARKWKDVAEGRVRDAQRGIEERLDQAREEVSSRVDTVKGALDAGREAAVEARHDIERKLEQSKVAYRAGLSAAREAVHEPVSEDS